MNTFCSMHVVLCFFSAVLLSPFTQVSPASAATPGFKAQLKSIEMDSGTQSNQSNEAKSVFAQIVDLGPEIPWVRIRFDKQGTILKAGSVIRVTSFLDGETQLLDAAELDNWGYATAFLNGPVVEIELIAGAGTEGNSIRIRDVLAGGELTTFFGEDAKIGDDEALPRFICNDVDTRQPAIAGDGGVTPDPDPRVGRLLPGGINSQEAPLGHCTAFIIDDQPGPDKLHLSAGHCFDGNPVNQDLQDDYVLQFNVPASNANCNINHPPVDRQFPVKRTAIYSRFSGYDNPHTGNDWAVFKCHKSNGRTSFQRQGAAFKLKNTPPPLGAVLNVEVIGHGTDGNEAGAVAGDPRACYCHPAAGTGRYNAVQQKSIGTTERTSKKAVGRCQGGANAGRPCRGAADCPDGVCANLVHVVYRTKAPTCGGNSGSPVINQANGEVVAIHTGHGSRCTYECNGGPNAGMVCCPDGGCNIGACPGGGAATCCVAGPNHSQPCQVNACPGGQCRAVGPAKNDGDTAIDHPELQDKILALGEKKSLPLDHFKVWLMDVLGVYHTVSLTDQFIPYVETILDRIDYIANAVDKNLEGIIDPDSHHLWYHLIQPIPQWPRQVIATNQFGSQQLVIGDAHYLLVPAQKLPHEPPQNLEHFLCYEVLQFQPINIPVTLEDQFDVELEIIEHVLATKPVYFCNPVSKNGHCVNNNDEHLIFYEILPPTIPIVPLEKQAHDQFNKPPSMPYPIIVRQSKYLGVPTQKIQVSPDSCPTCPGDLTGDGLINLTDIATFIQCLITKSTLPSCACADMNADSATDGLDIQGFVSALLLGNNCHSGPPPMGACCYADGSCADLQSPSACINAGGSYRGNNTLCAIVGPECPGIPFNDDCASKIQLTGSMLSVNFDTTFATTDDLPYHPGPDVPLDCASGQPPPPQPPIVADIFYNYRIPTNYQGTPVTAGDLIISTQGSTFNTWIVVYGDPAAPNPCGPALCSAPQYACNNYSLYSSDIPWKVNEISHLQIPVIAGSSLLFDPGDCIKLRIGGSGAPPSSQGFGQLNIDFIPRSAPYSLDTVRCCLYDGSCTITSTWLDCFGLGGYPRPWTDFNQGDPSVTEQVAGCKTRACPAVGNACYTALDFNALVGGYAGLFAQLSNDVLYYKYELPAGGSIILDTCDSDFDTKIAVYSAIESATSTGVLIGDCALNSLVAVNDNCNISGVCEDNFKCPRQSCLCLQIDSSPALAPGSIIYIAVGGTGRINGEPAYGASPRHVFDPVPNENGGEVLSNLRITVVPSCE